MDSFSNQSSSTNSNNNQREDFVDKALDSAEKKWGGSLGQNSEKNRNINEKITDTARDSFEKMTGMDVPDKISN